VGYTTKMKRKQGFTEQDDGTITTQSKMTTEDKIIDCSLQAGVAE